MNNIRLAITGHRLKHLGGYIGDIAKKKQQLLYDVIGKNLQEIKPTHIITGMALGVDQMVAKQAITLNIPFTAALPCWFQDKFWPDDTRKEYMNLLKQATEVIYVHNGSYKEGCMNKRNLWMLDRCDALLAVFNGVSNGGTAHCYNAALRRKIDIYRIIPQQVWLENGIDG